jgi:hypothetical protein
MTRWNPIKNNGEPDFVLAFACVTFPMPRVLLDTVT